MAKDGHIIGVAAVYLLPDRATGSVSSTSNGFQSILGGLEILKYRMIAERNDQHTDPPTG